MPTPLKPEYFWDIDVRTLDPKRHERLIVSRLLNFGTLEDWRWLVRTYGKDHLRELIRSRNRLGIREPARRLTNVIFE